MEQLKIRKALDKDFEELYNHLSVQSLLDMKAIHGFTGVSVLSELKDMSTEVISVIQGGKLAYCLFVIPTDNGEANLFAYSTTIGFNDITLSSVLNDLKSYNFYSIVYKGNKKLSSILKKVGFRFKKNIVYGMENKKFLVLQRLKDGGDK